MKHLWELVSNNDDLAKIMASLLVGGLIGLEREYRTKSAGLRTFTLICLGSTIFTILSEKVGIISSPDRIAANIVTGIGFLGAGVIFKTDDRVSGLTTATIIWITSALGMAIGDGHLILSLAGAITVVIILTSYTWIEKWVVRYNQHRSYKLTYVYTPENIAHVERLFRKHKLDILRGKQIIREGILCSQITAWGRSLGHEKLIRDLTEHSFLKEIEFS